MGYSHTVSKHNVDDQDMLHKGHSRANLDSCAVNLLDRWRDYQPCEGIIYDGGQTLTQQHTCCYENNQDTYYSKEND